MFGRVRPGNSVPAVDRLDGFRCRLLVGFVLRVLLLDLVELALELFQGRFCAAYPPASVPGGSK